MPSIVVKYLPRTEKRAPRFVAISNSGVRAQVDVTQYDSAGAAERAAVEKCIQKCGWHTEPAVWHRSGMTQVSNCMAVYIWPNTTYTQEMGRLVHKTS